MDGWIDKLTDTYRNLCMKERKRDARNRVVSGSVTKSSLQKTMVDHLASEVSTGECSQRGLGDNL